MIFPTARGYQGTIAVGFRRRPGAATAIERVGTVILKRTYTINPAAQSLTPSSAALPVFASDDPFDPDTPEGPFRYESDMVPFKPHGDVVVIGFTDVLVADVDVAHDTFLRVNGDVWLSREAPEAGGELALFGWEPRTESSREAEAGSFSEDPAHYPPQWPVVDPNRKPLPNDFDNRFFNGYSRTAAVGTPDYVPVGADIHIERPGPGNDYRFTLRSDTASASLRWHGGIEPDIEPCWERVDIAMHHDTLVIEPGDNTCYAVWRGTWGFDAIPPDGYRRLVVEATA